MSEKSHRTWQTAYADWLSSLEAPALGQQEHLITMLFVNRAFRAGYMDRYLNGGKRGGASADDAEGKAQR